jgi:hypothetical protein
MYHGEKSGKSMVDGIAEHLDKLEAVNGTRSIARKDGT